jgi:hypothetical protein
MEIGLRLFQDQFLHPIMVNLKKIEKIMVAKWGTTTKNIKEYFLSY